MLYEVITGTYRLLERILTKFGVTASYVDTNDLDKLESVRQPNTKAVFIETPTNPLMMVTDIGKVCSWAKQHQLLTIVDNTLLTQYFQRPLELGADIVVHSVITSYSIHYTKLYEDNSSPLVTIIPAKTSLCPPKYFVAL